MSRRDYWGDPTAPLVYPARVYRLVHYAIHATDRMSTRMDRRVGHTRWCECDLGYCCPAHAYIRDVAARYADMRERGCFRRGDGS